MKLILKISKPAAIFLAFQMLMLSGLYQSVSAAMIDTESIIHLNRGQNPRDGLNNLLAHEEMQAALISHGIDPQKARDLIDHLSDDEIAKFGQEIDRLPTGAGDSLGVVIGSIIALLLILIDFFYNNQHEK